MRAKGQILCRRWEDEEEGNGVQRRFQGVKKEKLEPGGPAGHPSPGQCGVGAESPQPPLEALSAGGSRAELRTLVSLRAQGLPCLLPSPLGSPLAPLLSAPSQGWQDLAPAG